MRWLVFVLSVSLLSGCAIGFGSARVGQWNPHRQVDFEACLVDSAPAGLAATAGPPRCKDRKQVVSEVPGRRFWGLFLQFPTIGYSRVSHQGESFSATRAVMTLEWLRGVGRWAVGVRGGLLVDSGAKRGDERLGMSAAELTALGHLSLVDRLSVYAGLGVLPYAVSRSESTFLGARGVAGVQLALSKTHSENSIMLTFELDRTYLKFEQTYQSTGVTGNLGLSF